MTYADRIKHYATLEQAEGGIKLTRYMGCWGMQQVAREWKDFQGIWDTLDYLEENQDIWNVAGKWMPQEQIEGEEIVERGNTVKDVIMLEIGSKEYKLLIDERKGNPDEDDSEENRQV